MDIQKIDYLMNEIRDCREKLKQDWSNFDNANPDYIDTAIANLKATEQRHKALCKELSSNVFGIEEFKKTKKENENIYKKILTFIK